MSKPIDDAGTPAVTEGSEALSNFKSEMDRKLANQSEGLENINLKLEALANGIAAANAPKAEPINEDLLYSDPAKYRAQIKEETLAQMRKENEAAAAVQNQRNQSAQAIISAFPEMSDPNNAMHKKVMEAYNSLPPTEQSNVANWTGISYRIAAEMGIKPASQRDEGEGYVMAGSGSRGSQKVTESGGIDDNMLTLAQLLDPKKDVNSPEYKARLEKATKRSFKNYHN